MHAFDMAREFFRCFFSRRTADFWLGASAKTLREMRAKLHAAIRAGMDQ
jgi:hypothetical protein